MLWKFPGKVIEKLSISTTVKYSLPRHPIELVSPVENAYKPALHASRPWKSVRFFKQLKIRLCTRLKDLELIKLRLADTAPQECTECGTIFVCLSDFLCVYILMLFGCSMFLQVVFLVKICSE